MAEREIPKFTLASYLTGTQGNWSGSQKGDKTVDINLGVDTSIYAITSAKLICHISDAAGGTIKINDTAVSKDSDVQIELPKTNEQSIYFYWKSIYRPGSLYKQQNISFTNIKIVYEYGVQQSKCTAPTSFDTNKSVCSLGGNVKLTWDGAVSGEAHAITGYQIQCKAKAPDGAWIPIDWKDVTTTGVVNEYTLAPSDNISSIISGDVEGCSVKYRIRAVTDNPQWNSNWLEGVFTITVSEIAKQQPLQILPPYKTVRIWRRIE